MTSGLNFFVGRSDELEMLGSLMELALGRQGQGALISGEAGIGKTRLVEEFASVADQAGFTPLTGVSSSEPGAPPYWPWVQVIRQCIQHFTPEIVAEAASAEPRLLIEMVPELRNVLSKPDHKTITGSPEQVRFRIFDATVAFFARLAKHTPLLVMLDDLQWADQSSLSLFEFVARSLGGNRILLTATCRDERRDRRDPFTLFLGEIGRVPNCSQVALKPLTREQTHQLVQAVTGREPDDGTIDDIQNRTAGNPFFVSELSRLISEDSNAEYVVDGRIPNRIRDTLLSRLAALPNSIDRLLDVAAVAGTSFDMKLVEEVIGSPTPHEAVSMAVAHRIINAVKGSPGRYRFSHPLIREVLYEQMDPANRSRIHMAVATALESDAGAAISEVADQLASHYAMAGTDDSKTLHYSLIAGDGALGVRAFESALLHFNRACDMTASRNNDEQRARSLAGLGMAMSFAAEPSSLPDAASALEQAFSMYLSLGMVDQAIEVARARVPHHGTAVETMNSIGARALDLVEPDSIDSAYVMAEYGRWMPDKARALAVLGQAFELAAKFKDEYLQCQVSADIASVHHFATRHEESLEWSMKAIKIANKIDNLAEIVEAYLGAHFSAYSMGKPEAAERYLLLAVESAERLRNRAKLSMAYENAAFFYNNRARWPEALEFARKGLAEDPENASLLHGMNYLTFHNGRVDEARQYFETLRRIESTTTTKSGYRIVGLALSAAITCIAPTPEAEIDQEKVEIAIRCARESLADERTPMWFRLQDYHALGIVAVATGDKGLAAEMLDWMLDHRDAGPAWAEKPMLGNLFGMLGRYDESFAEFEDGMPLIRSVSIPDTVRIGMDYGLLLLERGRHQDIQRATEISREILDVAEQHPSYALNFWSGRLADKIALVKIEDSLPAGLTEREVEVLALIAEGLSNPAIAERLVISVNTVIRHVSNIFSKTGCASRAEAAIWYERNIAQPQTSD